VALGPAIGGGAGGETPTGKINSGDRVKGLVEKPSESPVAFPFVESFN
jgi:hypothetical protein